MKISPYTWECVIARNPQIRRRLFEIYRFMLARHIPDIKDDISFNKYDGVFALMIADREFCEFDTYTLHRLASILIRYRKQLARHGIKYPSYLLKIKD
jgi:hypothetical protein